jgi:hypothetical protein
MVSVMKTIVSVTKTIVSVTKTIVSVTKTIVSVTKTIVSVMKTIVSVTETIVSMSDPIDSSTDSDAAAMAGIVSAMHPVPSVSHCLAFVPDITSVALPPQAFITTVHVTGAWRCGGIASSDAFHLHANDAVGEPAGGATESLASVVSFMAGLIGKERARPSTRGLWILVQ